MFQPEIVNIMLIGSTTNKPVQLSVLIPAKEVSGTTLKTIARVLNYQGKGSVQVVVLIDNDVPKIPDSMRAFANDVRFQILGGDAPSRGAAWARNTLAQVAVGRILLFADADAELDPEIIGHAFTLDAQLSRREVWVPSICPLQPENAIARFFSQFILSPNLLREFMVAPSTVFALRRADWSALGRFSERFPSAGGEDWEWMLRNHLRHREFSVRFEPEFKVPHSNPTTLRGLISRAWRYGSAAPLLENHFSLPERQQIFLQAPTCYFAKLRRLIGAIVSLLLLHRSPPHQGGFMEWRGRLLTAWSRRDVVPSLFLLFVFSTVYRLARRTEMRRGATRLPRPPVVKSDSGETTQS